MSSPFTQDFFRLCELFQRVSVDRRESSTKVHSWISCVFLSGCPCDLSVFVSLFSSSAQQTTRHEHNKSYLTNLHTCFHNKFQSVTCADMMSNYLPQFLMTKSFHSPVTQPKLGFNQTLHHSFFCRPGYFSRLVFPPSSRRSPQRHTTEARQRQLPCAE